MGLRLQPWIPLVTSAREGLFVGTGVDALEKLPMPAVASVRPMRSRAPARIQWSRPSAGKANGSRRSEARPSQRAPRKMRGGLAMTPAVSLAVCPAGSMAILPPVDDATEISLE